MAFGTWGVSIRDNITGKSCIIGMSVDQTGLGYQTFSADSAYSGGGSFVANERDPNIWIRLEYDGTNLNVYFSYNGLYFNLIKSVAVSVFLGAGNVASHVGFGINANNAWLGGAGASTLGAIVMDVLSWECIAIS
jgi:hypothetical protein